MLSAFLLRRRTLLAAAALLAATSLFALIGSGSSQAAAVATQPPACPVPGSSVQPLYMDTSFSFQERAADLVSCMTLPEKAQQLNTTPAPAIPSLGVKQYQYQDEGQHGVLANGFTSFPVNFASTMSWDPQLVYQETTAISDEARGFLDKSLWGAGQNNLGPSPTDYGMLTYWAPTVNMDRDPRWGRTDEAFGEDPYLAGQMADAFVDGYQGETMSGQQMTPYLKVAATAKHFALNNVEDNRNVGQLQHHGRQHPRLLHRPVQEPDRGRPRRRHHDLIQRGQRHPVPGRHLHGQRAAAADLRVQRVHHLRLRGHR